MTSVKETRVYRGASGKERGPKIVSYRVGVDIGGTFTDFALFDEARGRMAIHKQLTTAADPSVAVIEGLDTLLNKRDVPIDDVRAIVHGTTLVTNAVIERKGAITGMLTTAGFRDTLDMGMEQRYDLFDLRLRFPEPLVPRHRRLEIDERIRYDGEVERPLDLDVARRTITELIEAHGIEALAVCMLHSYANPAHEAAIRDLVRDEFPGLYVSASFEIFPNMREYERWTSATVNAYTQPMFDRYLGRLEAGLSGLGFGGDLYIRTSSGGIVTPETARRFPVRALESGPAAGALMSAFHGRLLDLPDLLSFDMGGTTAKGALIRDGAPLKKYDMEIARVHEFKRGSGLPVKIPAIDMIEIGAGGGSIAAVDDRGLFRVGPTSAGADPGPACYGRGGARPTLTDANIVLGLLDPDFFLGGEMALDGPAAEHVIDADIGRPLDLDLARAAWGIHEVINEDVARAFRIHASERGFDYRACSMIAYGGSGPVHALAIARKLKIPRVVFPVAAGVMSALGLLVSPLSFELARSNRRYLDDLTKEDFTEIFQTLTDEAEGFLRRAGTPREDIRVTRRLDMRYQGQGHDIEVTLPVAHEDADLLARLPTLFAERYADVFSLSFLDEPLEIVNWKVEASGPEPELADRYDMMIEAADEARKGSRRAYFPAAGGYVDCPVYDRYALHSGALVEGPALVEERESTCVLGVGDIATVDSRNNLIVELATAALDDAADHTEIPT